MSQWAAWGQYQQWGKPVRWLVAILLVIALAFVLAQTFWLLWYGPNEPIPSNSKTRLQVASSGQAVILSQSQVDSWQLFGSFEQEAAPQSDKPTDAPETRLRLELLGVFQTADTDKASAIIAEKGKEGELYRIGDSIPGNASLEEVYPDRVILRRAGRLETLRWSDSSLGGVSQVSRQPAVEREPQQSQIAEGSEEDMQRQRKAIIGQLGLQPVAQGDNQGYQLGKRAPKQLISQVGLQSNDVILSVNGHSLGTEEGDMAALRSFQETRQASIVVQRGDQQFTVNYPP
ncbi:MAG: general secretion pathway protein C [Alcanivorax sp.]|jgi:general secretion pathway protein C|uniref:type II secretion system protein GspC n=1 Tax=Alcanivorax sp. IL2 TaxID=3396310 RepID=UPI00260C11FB|nr:type II secretion system protein GspC [uncultured Alcanivorax sp.]